MISEQESTQAPTSVEDMTTQIPELSDETDDMKTMAPELEKEITTMQMIIDSVSEITTMVPESVPEMVPTDTRDKMPRLDDEGKINIFQNLIPRVSNSDLNFFSKLCLKLNLVLPFTLHPSGTLMFIDFP